MFNYLFMFLFLVLQSCSDHLSKHDDPGARYFSDATDCFHTTDRKENIDVKFGTREGNMLSSLNLEVPMGTEAGAFRQCMEYKGHPVTVAKANPDEYLNISRTCMDEASASAFANETYANCVKLGTISVEPIDPRKAKK